MSNWKKPAISRNGVEHEKQGALRDVQSVIWERGEQIQIVLIGEEKVERDDFGAIKRRIPATDEIFTFYAFPIIFTPTEEQQEKAGLREKTDVIVYTAMQDWIEGEISVDRLEKIDLTKCYVILDESKYEIKDKNKHDQFSDTCLYIVLGLNKI